MYHLPSSSSPRESSYKGLVLPKLKELRLPDGFLLKSNSDFKHLTDCMPALETFDLSSYPYLGEGSSHNTLTIENILRFAKKRSKTLKGLRLNFEDWTGGIFLKLANVPDLKLDELHLNVPEMFHQSLEILFKNQNQLSTLSLTGDIRMDCSILEIMTNLKYLSLKVKRHSHLKNLDNGLRHLNHMKSLSIDCHYMDWTELIDGIKGSSMKNSLTKLAISGSNLNEWYLFQILDLLPNLRHLSIHQSDYLSLKKEEIEAKFKYLEVGLKGESTLHHVPPHQIFPSW